MGTNGPGVVANLPEAPILLHSIIRTSLAGHQVEITLSHDYCIIIRMLCVSGMYMEVHVHAHACDPSYFNFKLDGYSF